MRLGSLRTVTATDIDIAAALEAEALEYPDARGEIMLEAAAARFRGGEIERGRALLMELIDAGGEDGCYARVELAKSLLDDGQVKTGYAQLSALAGDPALDKGHCGLVAELLVEFEDLDEGLRWYDRFVARMTPAEVEALRGPNGWVQFSSITLRGRRHVRRELGLPPDATDELVPVAPLERPVDVDDLRDQLDAGRPPPRLLRMLVFQQAERAEVRRRWPEEYTQTDDEYYPNAESRWREMAERGVRSIRLVPATVEGLVAFAERTGGSPTDPAVKSRYVNMVPEHQMLTWPPSRNAPCWCGSGAKYKKCCGCAG